MMSIHMYKEQGIFFLYGIKNNNFDDFNCSNSEFSYFLKKKLCASFVSSSYIIRNLKTYAFSGFNVVN